MEFDLNKIVEEHGPTVSCLARRMIQNRELAKDAAQEVWFEILKNIHTFNGNSQLSTWIYTIAKRTILKYSKNEKVSTILDLEEFRALPDIDYNGTEEGRNEWVKQRCDWCLTALNHCLNNDARMIFIFKETIGLSHKEISEIMEMKEENIRQIASRSLTKISHFLNDTCPLYNPQGTCKCRICKQVQHIDLDKEYTNVRKMVRLVNLYQKFEKDLPRKNYWEKFMSRVVTKENGFHTN